jgi:hypothetical protein
VSERRLAHGWPGKGKVQVQRQLPFLSRAPAKAQRLLHNALALGQWEVAALGARHLVLDRHADPALATAVLAVLRSLAEQGPPADWCAPTLDDAHVCACVRWLPAAPRR